MKILTVLTGGTIGSKRENHTLDVKGNVCEIIEIYKEKVEANTEFQIISPLNILSENMSVFYFNKLLKFLYEINFNDYDGVIVTHGSDTLSYTAALLGICFAHINVPMVLVAADYPLSYEKSNGLQNFIGAVELIKSKTVKGVFVSYGTKEITDIYFATRLCEADRFLDKFSDFTGTPFARLKSGNLEFFKSPYNPDLNEINKERQPVFEEVPVINESVQILNCYPSYDYESIIIKDNIKAFLQLTYHSGTISAEDKTVEFLNKCKQKGVDFYLCSLKKSEDLYATTRKITELNAYTLYNISRESAYAKLLLAYSQNKIKPQDFMEKNIFFETIL
ncbi:MAG: asparaginase [Ruminococcus sp.]|nr:asparaginase [Ruminococcus sp.]